jgi:hypothetical protein
MNEPRWRIYCTLWRPFCSEGCAINSLVPFFLPQFITNCSGFILIGISVTVSKINRIYLCPSSNRCEIYTAHKGNVCFNLTNTRIVHFSLCLLSFSFWNLLAEHKIVFLTELINRTNTRVQGTIYASQHCRYVESFSSCFVKDTKYTNPFLWNRSYGKFSSLVTGSISC